MEHLLAVIKGVLLQMENRAFLFFPDDTDPASGWKDFFAFADLYARLPIEFINSLGPYYFIIRMPSS